MSSLLPNEPSSDEGSTRRLLQLCAGYFVFYVLTGVAVKYFLGPADRGFPAFSSLEYLVHSTLGGNAICMVVVLTCGWLRLESARRIRLGWLSFPSELLYIVPSGFATAVVVPTTTLMYTLPISVMVAMVIMRGAVIVIGRLVDEVQIRQGILRKRLYPEENIAVLFALGAVGVNLLWAREGGFDFIESPAAVGILASYVVAYAIRIYIMNYFKNTRPAGVKLDNKGFFAFEQLTATVVLGGTLAAIVFASPGLGLDAPQFEDVRRAVLAPKPGAGLAVASGLAFGMVAFFSVFIFMFKGRSATFAGLVNRLTSLLAGTFSTLIFALTFGGSMPKTEDWASLAFILVAVAFLARAERKRGAAPRAAASLDISPTEGARAH